MVEIGVAIVGGGLAGLHAARRLQAAGSDMQVFEARARLGGRILSVDEAGSPTHDGFDLGPSWFWPRVQPAMARMVEELGLATFPQHFEGDAVFERMSREVPQRYRPVQQDAQSIRLSGGAASLVAALARDIPPAQVRLGTRVTAMALSGDGVALTVERVDGSSAVVLARQVICAVPPRLLEAAIRFTPALAPDTAARWRGTGTWMAPHAKFFAFYDRPFWREAGLSGTAQSFVGPLAEIHDATTASGHAALMGFAGVGAEARAALGQQAFTAACVAQLARVFGPEGGRPRATLIKDWAADELTATALDRAGGPHPAATEDTWVSGRWRGRLWLAGSETSLVEPGFMAGAIEAAEAAAGHALAGVGHPTTV